MITLSQETYRSPEEGKMSNIEKQDVWSIGIIVENIMAKLFKKSNFLDFDEEKLNYLISQKSNNP